MSDKTHTDEPFPRRYTFEPKVPEERMRSFARSGVAQMQYVFRTGGKYTMMDSHNYEQYELDAAQIGPQVQFLKERLEGIEVAFVLGYVAGVKLPDFVELEVAALTQEENVDHGSGNSLIAVLETGGKVEVQKHLLNVTKGFECAGPEPYRKSFAKQIECDLNS